MGVRGNRPYALEHKGNALRRTGIELHAHRRQRYTVWYVGRPILFTNEEAQAQQTYNAETRRRGLPMTPSTTWDCPGCLPWWRTAGLRVR